LFVALARGSNACLSPNVTARLGSSSRYPHQNFVLLWKTFLIRAHCVLESNVNWVSLTLPILGNFWDFIAKYTWVKQQTYSSLDSYFWVMRAITFLDEVLDSFTNRWIYPIWLSGRGLKWSGWIEYAIRQCISASLIVGNKKEKHFLRFLFNCSKRSSSALMLPHDSEVGIVYPYSV